MAYGYQFTPLVMWHTLAVINSRSNTPPSDPTRLLPGRKIGRRVRKVLFGLHIWKPKFENLGQTGVCRRHASVDKLLTTCTKISCQSIPVIMSRRSKRRESQGRHRASVLCNVPQSFLKSSTSCSGEIRGCCLNVRSVKNKATAVLDLISSNKYDLLHWQRYGWDRGMLTMPLLRICVLPKTRLHTCQGRLGMEEWQFSIEIHWRAQRWKGLHMNPLNSSSLEVVVGDPAFPRR